MLHLISLGGSLIVPNKVDVNFLKKFRSVILKHVRKGERFVIIAGGGQICRDYQNIARSLSNVNSEDLDWIGTKSTHLNAELVRVLFKGHVHDKVVEWYDKKESFREKILVAAGWKPGWSTDYDATVLAKWYGIKNLINLTNISHVYSKDPRKHKDAKPLKIISWRNLKKIIGNKWSPGLHVPFDPVAARSAEKLKLRVVIMSGLKNLDNFLSGKRFEGTIIS